MITIRVQPLILIAFPPVGFNLRAVIRDKLPKLLHSHDGCADILAVVQAAGSGRVQAVAATKSTRSFTSRNYW